MKRCKHESSSNQTIARQRARYREIFKLPQWWLQSGALLVILGVLAVFAASSPLFFTVGNLANVMQQSAVIGTLAFGLTLVLIGGGANGIAGGIDLSIAANLGFCAAVYATSLANGLLRPRQSRSRYPPVQWSARSMRSRLSYCACSPSSPHSPR